MVADTLAVVLAPDRPSRLAWCLGLAAALYGSEAGASGGATRAAEAAEAGEVAPETAPGRASEPAGAEVAARDTVVIALPEGDAILREATLRPALAGHFADTRFRPELRSLPAGDILAHLEWAEALSGDPSSSAPAGEPSHAVLWIETSRDGSQQLYLLQPSSGRVWVRALPMASEPEVAAESLGVMVRALALGLEDGEPVGMREVTIVRKGEGPARAEPVAPPPPEPVRKRPDVLVAVGYHGSSVSADRLWHSGAELRLGLRLPVGLLLELGAAWAPKAAGLREPRVDLERVPVDLRIGWQWRPHPRVHPQVDASVVAEALRWDLRSTDEITGRHGTLWRLGVAPGAGLTVRLWRALGLRLHAQADVWVRNAELVILDGNAREPVTRMHPVAGRLDAGLAIWL